MTTKPESKSYHHPDLRATLVATAINSLESGESYSLRAIATRAGVSATAPYRHFADRQSLDNAVAAEGFTALRTEMATALATTKSKDPETALTELGLAYVHFALRRPALYALMFTNECDERDSQRVQASQELHQLLGEALVRLFPTADIENLGTALWSLAHGIASLHLDGKLEPMDQVDERVRGAIQAVLAIGKNL